VEQSPSLVVSDSGGELGCIEFRLEESRAGIQVVQHQMITIQLGVGEPEAPVHRAQLVADVVETARLELRARGGAQRLAASESDERHLPHGLYSGLSSLFDVGASD